MTTQTTRSDPTWIISPEEANQLILDFRFIVGPIAPYWVRENLNVVKIPTELGKILFQDIPSASHSQADKILAKYSIPTPLFFQHCLENLLLLVGPMGQILYDESFDVSTLLTRQDWINYFVHELAPMNLGDEFCSRVS